MAGFHGFSGESQAPAAGAGGGSSRAARPARSPGVLGNRLHANRTLAALPVSCASACFLCSPRGHCACCLFFVHVHDNIRLDFRQKRAFDCQRHARGRRATGTSTKPGVPAEPGMGLLRPWIAALPAARGLPGSGSGGSGGSGGGSCRAAWVASLAAHECVATPLASHGAACR